MPTVEADYLHLMKRTHHVFKESLRVLEFRAAALDKSVDEAETLSKLGEIMNASHVSFVPSCPFILFSLPNPEPLPPPLLSHPSAAATSSTALPPSSTPLLRSASPTVPSAPVSPAPAGVARLSRSSLLKSRSSSSSRGLARATRATRGFPKRSSTRPCSRRGREVGRASTTSELSLAVYFLLFFLIFRCVCMCIFFFFFLVNREDQVISLGEGEVSGKR